MPTVKRWADELRAVFGAAEVQAGFKSQGYYASEGGRVIDTRPARGAMVSVADMVLALPDAEPAPMVKGRRG